MNNVFLAFCVGSVHKTKASLVYYFIHLNENFKKYMSEAFIYIQVAYSGVIRCIQE